MAVPRRGLLGLLPTLPRPSLQNQIRTFAVPKKKTSLFRRKVRRHGQRMKYARKEFQSYNMCVVCLKASPLKSLQMECPYMKKRPDASFSCNYWLPPKQAQI
eukprot:jgi/Bigna1/60755/fgenesh1_kg.14_\